MGLFLAFFFRPAVEKPMERRHRYYVYKGKTLSRNHVINCVAEAYRKEQSLRKSKLSIRDTIQMIIGAEGGSLAKELHRAGYDVSASALTQRRAQIPANVFRDIFMGFNGRWAFFFSIETIILMTLMLSLCFFRM